MNIDLTQILKDDFNSLYQHGLSTALSVVELFEDTGIYTIVDSRKANQFNGEIPLYVETEFSSYEKANNSRKYFLMNDSSIQQFARDYADEYMNDKRIAYSKAKKILEKQGNFNISDELINCFFGKRDLAEDFVNRVK